MNTTRTTVVLIYDTVNNRVFFNPLAPPLLAHAGAHERLTLRL